MTTATAKLFVWNVNEKATGQINILYFLYILYIFVCVYVYSIASEDRLHSIWSYDSFFPNWASHYSQIWAVLFQ